MSELSAKRGKTSTKALTSPPAVKKSATNDQTNNAGKAAVKLPAISTQGSSPTKKKQESTSKATATLPPHEPGKKLTAAGPKSCKGSNVTGGPSNSNSASQQAPPQAERIQVEKDDRGSEQVMELTNPTAVVPSTVVDTIVGSSQTVLAQIQLDASPNSNADETRLLKEKGNGAVKLVYEQYDELFPITDGSTTQSNIDEVYCLSFVMPNCLVHLSRHNNVERFSREENGIFDSLLPENPQGVYHGLETDQTYYVVVEQEADQLKRDQEATKAKWGPSIKQAKLDRDDGRGFESCSCIYGNPCVDEYGCKDWHSRFAIATANGWKGF